MKRDKNKPERSVVRKDKWHRLTDVYCRNVTKPGKHRDSPNLILRVDSDGNKSFAFRYALDGIERTLGLGAYPAVSLADAREKAAVMRKQLATGIDPKTERTKERIERAKAASRIMTFKQATLRFIADREGTWTNEQHRRDFRNSLNHHVLPLIGAMRIADIGVPEVLNVLEHDGFWRTRPVAADRTRARVEMILDWAKTRGYRDGDNPAVWRGRLDSVLPAPATLRPVRHHAMLDWRALPQFMSDLRRREGLLPRTLEFCILNANRIGETLGATWAEFDLAARTWTIPGTRMKTRRPHIVPLSKRSIEILRERLEAADQRDVELNQQRVFPTHRATAGAFLRKTLGHTDFTLHGTARATFRTWCQEATRVAPELAEAALAHAVRGETARYQRGSLLAKRRALMERWSACCASPVTRTTRLRSISAPRSIICTGSWGAQSSVSKDDPSPFGRDKEL
jgi:integrase